MIGYLRNNIAFRRFTAERYGDFYKAKAFLLGEVLESTRHEFTSSARESLLQYLSASESWLQEIERRFICSGNEACTPLTSEEFQASFSDMEESVLSLMREHPEDFPTLFVDCWSDMRWALRPHILGLLGQQLKADMFDSFRLIAEFIIGYMNFTLFNLHEIDYIFCKRESPFIYADKIDLCIMEKDAVSSPALRSDTYRSHGLLADYELPLRAKIHIDDKYINSNEERALAYRQLRSSLDSYDAQFF